MARNIPYEETPIYPLFSIPEGAEDQLKYLDEPDEMAFEEEEDELNDIDSTYYDDGYDNEIVGVETPENFYILSQTIRRAPGGQQVVDVIVEAEDVVGAVRYEIQVTKVDN